MKILLVSNMYPSNNSDFYGVFIKNIEDALIKNGVSVDKIVIKGRGKTFVSKIKKYFLFYKEILLIDFSKYDYVHLSYPSHTYLPFFLKRIGKTKLLVRLHGHDMIPIKSIQKFLFIFTKKAIERADIVIVPSNYFYKELLKIKSPKDYYIYPSGGLDIEKFYPKDKEIYSKKLILGYVGRIEDGKGVDILIKAVSKLVFNFELFIIGTGNLEKKMKKLSKELKRDKKIKFIGRIPNDELVDFYNKFDIFIFPTLMEESFGNVAIEAMGCKVPIIGSKIGGLTDYIYEGENGYFYETGNIDSLVSKIIKFNYLSKEKKDKMSERAYEVALKYEKNNLTVGLINKLKKEII